MDEQLPEDVLDTFQDRLQEYNANFDRVDGLLGPRGLLESDAERLTRIENTKEVLSEVGLKVAVNSLIHLAGRAESESVRASCSKYIIALNFGKDPAMQAVDPAMELIARLRGETVDEG